MVNNELTDLLLCFFFTVSNNVKLVFQLTFLFRDRTLSMREGGWWRVFTGVMKYFRHILMSHEIFLKIFDGPQNIFLCSFLILTFSKFISKFK